LAALSVFCSPRSRWTMGENPLSVGVAAYTRQSYPIPAGCNVMCVDLLKLTNSELQPWRM
jgi:hypothetical protein